MVFDAQGLEPELVAVPLGCVEWLVEGVGAGGIVDIGQTAGAQPLVEVARRDRESIDGLEHRAQANGVLLDVVDIVILGFDRGGEHVAAYGVVRTIGAVYQSARQRELSRRDHHAIDPAGIVAIGGDDAQRRLVAPEGQIHHAILGMVESAVIGVGEFHLCRRVERLGVRGIGHNLDRAAHRAGAIERALRAAQHLDAVEIVEIGRDHDLALIGRGGRRRNRSPRSGNCRRSRRRRASRTRSSRDRSCGSKRRGPSS